MREFRITIEDSFKTGIRQDTRGKLGEPTLESATNVKPSKYGLIRCSTVTARYSTSQLTAAGITTNYPFPALFLVGAEKILLDGTKAYSAESTPVAITTYNITNTSSALDPLAGISWDFVDMNTAWLAVNSACAVLRTNLHNIAGSTFPDKYLVDSSHFPTTACFHRGRVIQGGWSANSNHPLYGALDTTSVMWSTIGGGDVFLPYLDSCPDYTLDTTWAQKLLDRNEGGVYHLAQLGVIHTALPLGKAVVLYGTNGVGILTLAGSPVPTYGYEDIHQIGIINQGAAAVGKGRQIFVSRDGKVYEINSEFSLRELGYEELVEEFNALESKQVMYDPLNNEFIITDGIAGFVLTDHGIGEQTHLSTSLSMSSGILYGIPVTSSTTDFDFVTTTLDMGLPMLKHVSMVEVGGSSLYSMEVSIYYRYAEGEGFVQTSWKPVNAQGWAHVGVTGKEFKIAVRGTLADTSIVKYINIAYKTPDKRALRGFYQAGRGT